MTSRRKFHSGAALHIGRNPKRLENEDRAGVYEPVAENLSESLYLVCDGMGGHAEGALASQIAVDEIADAYRQARRKHEPRQALRRAIHRAHRAIRQAGKGLGRGRSMGTTVVAAVVQGNRLFIANVGDSRAYLVGAGEIRQVTLDHTRSAELAALSGLGTAELNLGAARHALTRSLSSRRKEVEPDLFEETFEADAVLVLCSDGLWSMVPEPALAQTARAMSPQEAAEALVKQANRAGGRDNICVVVVAGEKPPEEEDTGEIRVGAAGS